MELKKYKKTKDDLEHYDTKITTLNELLKEAKQKRQIICDECNHDFVFVYNRDDRNLPIHYIFAFFKDAKCLVCGEYFKLNEDYIEFGKDELLQSKNIIDATKFLSEYTQKSYRNNENEAYRVVKLEFDQIIEDDNGHLRDEQIIEQIIEAVKELDKRNIAKEEERKENYGKIKK